MARWAAVDHCAGRRRPVLRIGGQAHRQVGADEPVGHGDDLLH